MDADVLISGAGPAGSMAAYELAIRGVPVLILEKSDFPRYKVCGAGLTHKIIRQIPFDISHLLETKIQTIKFSSGFRDGFTRCSSEPMMYCSSRDKFDDYLLRKAVEAGARIIHGEQVVEVFQEKDFVTAVTKTGNFRSKLLIGADGASGIVARSAGLRADIKPGLAWEAEVKVDPQTIKVYSNTMFLDWGAFPGGYAWVFPKGDHFSIGVGGPATLAKWMMPYYRKLVDYIGGEEMTHPIHILETISLKSWPIPVRVKRSRFHNGRILVTGDAAGLTDPLTGEGIYYAVRSGLLAAESSHEYLKGANPSLESFTRAVNDELMAELLEANRIKFLFNTAPLKIHHFVRDNDRAWRAFVKILRAERWYKDVQNGFGKWRFLWRGTCTVTAWLSWYREKRFAKNGFR